MAASGGAVVGEGEGEGEGEGSIVMSIARLAAMVSRSGRRGRGGCARLLERFGIVCGRR